MTVIINYEFVPESSNIYIIQDPSNLKQLLKMHGQFANSSDIDRELNQFITDFPTLQDTNLHYDSTQENQRPVKLSNITNPVYIISTGFML